jgi:anti-sigma factor RsiW
MNTTAHTVSPEDLMAFLDGELSASAAESVAAHLAECEECAGIVTQFRNISQSLSLWTVPAPPDDMESTIKELAADAAYSHRYARRDPWFRGGSGSWKPWAVAAGIVVAAAFLVMPFSLFQFRMNHVTPLPSKIRQSERALGSQLSAMNVIPGEADAMISADQIARLRSADAGRQVQLLASSTPTAPVAQKIAPTISPTAPMIARTANVTMMAKDFAASRSALDQILARHHGYFAQLNVDTPEEGPRSIQASLRIPAPDLPSALTEIRSVGRVLSETQSGEEVTQQHQDLAIRLQNARETEERFRAILEQRTGKLADVLAVEEGIARIRGQIEGMEAEQKALEHRVDFAAVEIRLSEEYKARIDVPDNSASTRLHNAFVAGYHNASETILGIVLFLEEFGPAISIWLVILALPVIGWRRYRRLRSKL